MLVAVWRRDWHEDCCNFRLNWRPVFSSGVLQLTFHDSSGAPAAVLGTTDVRITGGVLWNQVEHGLIACFSSQSWRHRGTYYPSISIAGRGCLAFGIARESLISEEIGLFAMTGATFRANGVAIAQYDEKLDLWQGLIRQITWQAMRVISVAVASALVESTRTTLLNPWDYPGSASPSAIFSSKYTA